MNLERFVRVWFVKSLRNRKNHSGGNAMKRARFFVTWILVALMVIEPFAMNMAVMAADAETAGATTEQAQPAASEETVTPTAEQQRNAATAAGTEAQAGSDQTEDASKKLNDTNTISTNGLMGRGTKREIREANKQLNASKAQVNDVKGTAKEAAGSVKEIGAATKGSGNTFEKLTKVKAAAQKALIKIGQLLQKIGQLLKTVGTALVSIGTALQSNPWTASIGAALVSVGKVLIKVGTALDYVGKAIEKVGQTAADVDKNFSDIIKDITGAAKTGWEEGGKVADKTATDSQAAVDAGNKADTTKDAEQGTTETTTSTEGEVLHTDQPSGE